MASDRVPAGYEKDTPWPQASLKTVKYYATEGKNAMHKAAATAELQRRDAGGAQEPPDEHRQAAPASPQQSESRAVALRSVQEMMHGYRDAAGASTALQKIQQHCHLITPATSCGTVPEGHEIVLSMVTVDPKTETYSVAGGLSLAKSALDKIAAAAGVLFHPVYTRRQDDGSDPYYCHYTAVAAVMDFAKRWRLLPPGEVEMDLREGSPQVEEIRTKAKRRNEEEKAKCEAQNRRFTPNDGGASQILELRKFMLRHARSKAANAAIRSLGVHSRYTEAELAKPFVVAALMFTGRTDDPALKPIFGAALASGADMATLQIFGSAPEPDRTASQQHVAIVHRPPPPGTSMTGEVVDVTPEDDPDAHPPGPDDPDQSGLFDKKGGE